MADPAGDIGLIVDVGGLVIAGGGESSQHVFGCLVAQPMHLAVGAVSVTDIQLCTEQAGAEARLESRGTLIGDIEHGGHLVVVLHAVATCREMDVLHHLGIDERQSFLLSGADEQRPIDLNAVDINRVLVERSAADIVLRTEFIGLAHAGERDEQTLDGSARGIRHDARGSGVDTVHHALCMLNAAHFDLRQQLFVRQELHIDVKHVVQVDDALLHGSVANHREVEHDGVGLVEQQLVIAVFVGGGTERLVRIEHDHISQFDTHIVLIDHIAIDPRGAGEDRSTEYRTQSTDR